MCLRVAGHQVAEGNLEVVGNTTKTLRLRNYQASDETKLEQLCQQNQQRVPFFVAERSPYYRQTVVALESEELESAEGAEDIIGFASLYHNPHHYHPCDFRVNMLADGLELAQALHNALLQALPTPLARIRMIRASGDSLPAQLGYQPLLGCFEPVLDMSAWISSHDAICRMRQVKLEQLGYRFVTLAEWDRQRDAEIVALCLEAYADTHTHSPPNQHENWAETFLNTDALIPEAFFLVLKENKPIAFSSLQQSSQQSSMEAMWDGVARSERALAYPLRLVLKMREVAYAQQHGVQTLCWEVDSVDVVGMQLLEALPFQKDDTSVMWVQDIMQ